MSILLAQQWPGGRFACYEDMRAQHPEGVYNEPLGKRQLTVILSHEHALSVLRSPHYKFGQAVVDPQRFSEQSQELLQFRMRMLLFRDGEDHDRIRRPLTQPFSPREIGWIAKPIANITTALLDDAARKPRPMDAMRDFAELLPLQVILATLGMSPEDAERVKHISVPVAEAITVAVANQAVYEAARDNVIQLRTYLDDFLQGQRALPEDKRTPIMNAFLGAESRGVIDDAELKAQLALLIVAGHETTARLIANAVLALTDHPEQLQLLRDDPDGLAREAAEETLRMFGSGQMVSRIATSDTQIGELIVPSGQGILVVLGAADRHSAAHKNPNEFRIRRWLDYLVGERPEARPLGFSSGSHTCLGAQLAMMEVTEALKQLVQRFPDLRIDGSVTIERDAGTLVLYGPNSVPLTDAPRLLPHGGFDTVEPGSAPTFMPAIDLGSSTLNIA